MDHFDIVERVEMGQMASMFFNKGNVLVASGVSQPHQSVNCGRHPHYLCVTFMEVLSRLCVSAELLSVRSPVHCPPLPSPHKERLL